MIDGEFWILIIKIILFLPLILFLMYLSLKYGGNKLQKLQDGKYMKIIDRIALSKENSILVVKIGEKAYTIASSSKKIEVLFEIPKEEITIIEDSKEMPQYEDIKEVFKKLITKKEDKYEKKK